MLCSRGRYSHFFPLLYAQIYNVVDKIFFVIAKTFSSSSLLATS